jgi:hybrid cluster-associated redox disulfide protein
MDKQINKSMTVLEALQIDPNIAGILMQEGMHCIFCGAAAGESLQEAGYVHGIGDQQMDEIVDRINDFLKTEPDPSEKTESAAQM